MDFRKLIVLVFIILISGLGGSIGWNGVMPAFGLPRLTMWQFLCLVFVLRVLLPTTVIEKKE